MHAAVGEDLTRRSHRVSRAPNSSQTCRVATGAGAVEPRTQMRLRGSRIGQYVRYAVCGTGLLNERGESCRQVRRVEVHGRPTRRRSGHGCRNLNAIVRVTVLVQHHEKSHHVQDAV